MKNLLIDKDLLSIDLLTEIGTNCKFLDYLSTYRDQMDNIRTPLDIRRVRGTLFKAFISPPVKVHSSTWSGLMEFIEENDKNYFLDDLNPVDYFEGQSH